MKFKELFTNFPDFKQITNLSIDNIEISHLTVLDAPDFYNWCRPKELPVTSGYIFKQGLVDLKETIEHCVENDIVGMAIKVDRYLKEIPADVIEYAESKNFPLIYIPLHYPFSKVILPVMNTSLSRGLDEMADSEAIRAEFIKLALEGDNIAEIVGYLHHVLDTDVFYYNTMTQELYKNGLAASGLTLDFDQLPSREVIFANEQLGILYYAIDDKELTYTQETAISYAVKIIQLVYKELFSLQKVKEEYMSNLVEDICHNNIKNMEELRLRSNLHGWHISDHLSVVIFDIDHYKERTIKFSNDNDRLARISNQMYKDIIRQLNQANITHYTFRKSDSYVFILENQSFESKTDRDHILESIRLNLHDKFDFTFTVSLGNDVVNVLDTPKSYKQAIQGVQLGQILYKGNCLLHYQDVEPYTLMADMAQDISSNHSLMQPILDLKAYDQAKGTEFLEDLKALIAADWNVSEFSKNEIIHYNTAQYRLKKIEKLTNLDLSQGHNKFNAEFALKLYQVKHGL